MAAMYVAPAPGPSVISACGVPDVCRARPRCSSVVRSSSCQTLFERHRISHCELRLQSFGAEPQTVSEDVAGYHLSGGAGRFGDLAEAVVRRRIGELTVDAEHVLRIAVWIVRYGHLPNVAAPGRQQDGEVLTGAFPVIAAMVSASSMTAYERHQLAGEPVMAGEVVQGQR